MLKHPLFTPATAIHTNSFAKMQHTIDQRVQIIQIYWENKESMELTLRKLDHVFGAQGIPVPSAEDIRILVSCLWETGSVCIEEQLAMSSDEGQQEEEEEEEDNVVVEIQNVERPNKRPYPEDDEQDR